MTRPALRLSLLGLLGLSTCGRPPVDLPPQEIESEAQRFAAAVCGARATCDCDDGRFESQTACESELSTRFMTEVDEGMAFDANCLDSLMNSEVMTCAAWPWEFDYAECRVLSRERGLGEPCKWHFDLHPAHVSDCAEELYCFNGVCANEVNLEIPIGEPCEQGIAQPCIVGAYCGADDICHARAPLGEPCTDFFGCGTGLYCEGLGAESVGTCAQKLSVGELCDPRDWVPCASGPDFAKNGCKPTNAEEYRCVDEETGICYLTFPLTHP